MYGGGEVEIHLRICFTGSAKTTNTGMIRVIHLRGCSHYFTCLS